jgi:hypothetical protein
MELIKLESYIKIFMSMAQARYTRVGTTFENHYKNYIDGHAFPNVSQEKVDGKKKPDFIFPSKEYYFSETREIDDIILLSLKTSLKERWQQILNEGSKVKTRYLATLDKKVTGDQISEMKRKNVILIVTEWAKVNTESYKNASNVITFKNFEGILMEKKIEWSNDL